MLQGDLEGDPVVSRVHEEAANGLGAPCGRIESAIVRDEAEATLLVRELSLQVESTLYDLQIERVVDAVWWQDARELCGRVVGGRKAEG